eukprot:11149709-Alexandrium_andersonii.AAC.1
MCLRPAHLSAQALPRSSCSCCSLPLCSSTAHRCHVGVARRRHYEARDSPGCLQRAAPPG